MTQPLIRISALDFGPGNSKVCTTDGSGNLTVGAGSFTAGYITGDTFQCNNTLYLHGGVYFTQLLFGSTTNATPTEIFIGGGATRYVLANNMSVSFRANIIARRTDGVSGESAAYLLHGLAKRVANAAATTVTYTTLSTIEDQAVWNIVPSADVTNGALIFTATGEAAKTISWRIILEATQNS
jgi:hypothetical protein